MNVFLWGSDGQPPPRSHTIIVTPAAHLRGQECPHDWVDLDNKPIQFEVHFVHGRAEVDDPIGKYLIKTGLAQKSRLILPQHAFAE